MILFLHSGDTGLSFYPWVNIALFILLGITVICLLAGVILMSISFIKDSNKISSWGLKILMTTAVWAGVTLLMLLAACVFGWYTTGSVV